MSTQKVDVFCPQCKAKLAVPVTAMGKSGKCPHCQHVFPLAMPAQRAAAPAAAVSPLSPLTPLTSGPASPLSPFAPAAYAAPALAPLDDDSLMPLSDAGLTPLPASNQFAPRGGGNPFAEAAPQGDYTLQPMAPSPYAPSAYVPTNASIAAEHVKAANAAYNEAEHQYRNTIDGAKWGFNAGIGGGAAMMLISIVWGCAGILVMDYLFYAPIFIFVVGLIAFFKGIADNFSR